MPQATRLVYRSLDTRNAISERERDYYPVVFLRVILRGVDNIPGKKKISMRYPEDINVYTRCAKINLAYGRRLVFS